MHRAFPIVASRRFERAGSYRYTTSDLPLRRPNAITLLRYLTCFQFNNSCGNRLQTSNMRLIGYHASSLHGAVIILFSDTAFETQ